MAGEARLRPRGRQTRAPLPVTRRAQLLLRARAGSRNQCLPRRCRRAQRVVCCAARQRSRPLRCACACAPESAYAPRCACRAAAAACARFAPPDASDPPSYSASRQERAAPAAAGGQPAAACCGGRRRRRASPPGRAEPRRQRRLCVALRRRAPPARAAPTPALTRPARCTQVTATACPERTRRVPRRSAARGRLIVSCSCADALLPLRAGRAAFLRGTVAVAAAPPRGRRLRVRLGSAEARAASQRSVGRQSRARRGRSSSVSRARFPPRALRSRRRRRRQPRALRSSRQAAHFRRPNVVSCNERCCFRGRPHRRHRALHERAGPAERGGRAVRQSHGAGRRWRGRPDASPCADDAWSQLAVRWAGCRGCCCCAAQSG